MGKRAVVILALLVAAGPVAAQTGDPAEPAMDAYVACLNKRFEGLKSACERADLVATAVMTGCVAEERNLENAIAPAFRVFEEMKLGMLAIRQAQGRRILTHLIEYRAAKGTCTR